MAEEKETKEEEKTAAKKPLLKWIILAGVVVVLGAGGFFGWRMFLGKDKAEAAVETSVAAVAPKKAEETPRVICPLESFIVNLMDSSGQGKRYLKTTIELEVDNEAARNRVAQNKAQLKDTILMLLTSQSFKEISTVEGKLDLKQALLTRVNQTLGGGVVRRIYFTEFVVQ